MMLYLSVGCALFAFMLVFTNPEDLFINTRSTSDTLAICVAVVLIIVLWPLWMGAVIYKTLMLSARRR